MAYKVTSYYCHLYTHTLRIDSINTYCKAAYIVKGEIMGLRFEVSKIQNSET